MRVALMSIIRWTVRCGGEPPIAGPLADRPDPPSGSGALPNVDCWRRPLANVERSHNHRWIRRFHANLAVLPCLLIPTSAFASRYELPRGTLFIIAVFYLGSMFAVGLGSVLLCTGIMWSFARKHPSPPRVREVFIKAIPRGLFAGLLGALFSGLCGLIGGFWAGGFIGVLVAVLIMAFFGQKYKRME